MKAWGVRASSSGDVMRDSACAGAVEVQVSQRLPRSRGERGRQRVDGYCPSAGLLAMHARSGQQRGFRAQCTALVERWAHEERLQGTLPRFVSREVPPHAHTEHPRLVVMLHGLTATPDRLRPFAEALSQQGYHVVTWCLPGHGRPIDATRLPEDVPAVLAATSAGAMRAWGVERIRSVDALEVPWAVVAHSLGAATLLGAIRQVEPKHLRGEVWLAPFLGSPNLLHRGALSLRSLAPERFDRWFTARSPVQVTDDAHDPCEGYGRVPTQMPLQATETADGAVQACREAHQRSSQDRGRVPSTVIFGSVDPLSSRGRLQPLAETASGAFHCVEIPGADHGLVGPVFTERGDAAYAGMSRDDRERKICSDVDRAVTLRWVARALARLRWRSPGGGEFTGQADRPRRVVSSRDTRHRG